MDADGPRRCCITQDLQMEKERLYTTLVAKIYGLSHGIQGGHGRGLTSGHESGSL